MKDPWNDKKYVILPQKIRIKMKDMREQHAIMWQQLSELNDKLLIHNQKQVEVRRPVYEQKFYDKKRDELANKLSALLKQSEAKMQRLFKDGDTAAETYLQQMNGNPQLVKQNTLLAITKRETFR